MEEKKDIRLLAAIMFADMVGYTKTMQQNEQKAKELRDRQRKVVDLKTLEQRGQVMQYYGDGTLSMFGSAIDAVHAATEIQKELSQTEPKVPLRIGIHLGDVVYDDDGIYGDAVNLAARVQSLGTPGSVMISGKVFDEIRNHPGIRVEAFGEHELKNVFQPISIFALANEGLDVPSQQHVQEITGSYQHSIAVLPFVNFSSDPENEYFSDGITEEIINLLAQVKKLDVASRTSVFVYKHSQKDVREIGKELNVAAVLEGSVRKAGKRIRVTAQLINTANGFHIWSENFDGELTDIFEMQDEIARKIVAKLEGNEFFEKNKKLSQSTTQSVEAYNFYLKGLYYSNKRTPEAMFKAIQNFEKAITHCSTYTNAYSALSNCYTFLGTVGMLPADEAFVKAEQLATKSVELNNNRADSYIALGLVNLFFKWNFEQAGAYLRKAITLEPNHAAARAAIASYFQIYKDYDKVLYNLNAAVKLDPLNLSAKIQLAGIYSIIGKQRKALQLLDETLELDPNYRGAYEGRAIAYALLGDFEEAKKEAQKYLSLISKADGGGAFLGYLGWIMDDRSMIEQSLEQLIRHSKRHPEITMSLDFASVYACLGDADTAFKYLFEGVEKRLGAMIFFDAIPSLLLLKTDPRFEELKKRIGLPSSKEVNQINLAGKYL